MRHSSRFRAVLLFTLTGAGCVAPGGEGAGGGPPLEQPARVDLNPTPSPVPPPEPSWGTLDPPPPPPDAVAWTGSGKLALVDGATGAVKQEVDPGPLVGERDLVYDAPGKRLLVYTREPGGPTAEVFSVSVSTGAGGPSLGARTHLASVEGSARLLPARSGVVLFGMGEGGRWRLMWHNGAATPSVPGPHPMSAWVVPDGEGEALHALAYGPSSGELDAVDTRLGRSALPPPSVHPLPVSAGTVPPSARLVPAPARGGALLVDVEGDALTVRGMGSGAPGPKAKRSLGGSGRRIEAALACDGGREVVLLLSGKTEIVALQIDASLGIGSVAVVPLPGHPEPSTRFLSHDLSGQGAGRILAATSAGVFSVEVDADAAGVTLGVDPGFHGGALLGPVAAIVEGEP